MKRISEDFFEHDGKIYTSMHCPRFHYQGCEGACDACPLKGSDVCSECEELIGRSKGNIFKYVEDCREASGVSHEWFVRAEKAAKAYQEAMAEKVSANEVIEKAFQAKPFKERTLFMKVFGEDTFDESCNFHSVDISPIIHQYENGDPMYNIEVEDYFYNESTYYYAKVSRKDLINFLFGDSYRTIVEHREQREKERREREKLESEERERKEYERLKAKFDK